MTSKAPLSSQFSEYFWRSYIYLVFLDAINHEIAPKAVLCWEIIVHFIVTSNHKYCSHKFMTCFIGLALLARGLSNLGPNFRIRPCAVQWYSYFRTSSFLVAKWILRYNDLWEECEVTIYTKNSSISYKSYCVNTQNIWNELLNKNKWD